MAKHPVLKLKKKKKMNAGGDLPKGSLAFKWKVNTFVLRTKITIVAIHAPLQYLNIIKDNNTGSCCRNTAITHSKYNRVTHWEASIKEALMI